ncbi:MAG: hypothetical protein E7Z75_09650 [Methanobrevibacter olleyae]|uniref:Uncharacterized protein n=1 Tax=Methanobrevibacter olleyae TaxID=294671 RepID=A0A8T3VPY9_METOL|nr:hypothetical protein [Methanobrevibacter olleyae]
MNKKKIFGYVENERNTFMEDVKSKLIEREHMKASKSKIIELALMELENNNDFLSIEDKLLSNELI